MDNGSTEASDKISALLNQAYSLRTTELDQSLSLATEALQLSRESGQHTLISKGLSQLSLFHMMRGEHEQSVQLLEEVIDHSAKVEDAFKTAGRKNQELDSFFHRVSHDLKGPITSLISLDAISRDLVKDDNILKFMDMSITQVYRMNHILDELIKLARISNQEEVIQEIDFAKIIGECLITSQALSNFDKVKLESDVQENLKYSAPWALINTIIQNLIDNGINYARVDQPNPFVKLSVAEQDGMIKIVVVDNGTGMKKEIGKNIFEMFFRANKQVVGSGLGLYLLNIAVEKLNGTVELDSEIESGSTFTILLPINQPAV